MKKFKNKYRIPSSRLQNWDYANNGLYFITICTKNRTHYFGKIINNKMQYSSVGAIAHVMWNEIKHHSKNIELGEFVIMPNHIHGILILSGNDAFIGNNSIINNDGDCMVDKGGDMNNDGEKNDNDGTYNYDVGDDGMNDDGGGGTNDNNDGGTNDDGKTNDDDGGTNNDGKTVETRHALSLPLIPFQKNPLIQNNSQFPLNPSKNIGPNRFQKPGKNSISSIVGGYKSSVSKYAHRLGFEFEWQSRFYDHIIQNQDAFLNISNYIANNPKNWIKDKFSKNE